MHAPAGSRIDLTLSPTYYFTKPGAFDLAQQIERHWALRGKRVKTRLERMEFRAPNRHVYEYWVVRSDMVNGLPRAA